MRYPGCARSGRSRDDGERDGESGKHWHACGTQRSVGSCKYDRENGQDARPEDREDAGEKDDEVEEHSHEKPVPVSEAGVVVRKSASVAPAALASAQV
jgi:hypothetical protein